MENINFEFEKGIGFVLKDFPDAVKIIKLDSKKSQELADMALHKSDLDVSLECIDFLKKQKDSSFEEMIFWKMSIIYFMKCFGSNNARKNRLNINEILDNDTEGLEVFEYFKNFRDKNIAHDDNAFQQCIPSAVLNKEKSKYKIAKITCLNIKGEVSSIENISNLKLLIEKTRLYVINRFDVLCNDITEELEKCSYHDLINIEPPKYSKPVVEDMSMNRKKQ